MAIPLFKSELNAANTDNIGGHTDGTPGLHNCAPGKQAGGGLVLRQDDIISSGISSGKIRVHVLECGTVRLRPRDISLSKGFSLTENIELPNNAFLIEHPLHGNILIDTGWSADAAALLPEHLKLFYRPQIMPHQTAKAQLKELGLEPEDIDLVLLTHLDVDHTCALKDFAGRAKRIICAELEYFYACRTVYKLRQVWDTWMPWNGNIEKIHYRACSMGPVGRGFDLFGDEDVLCVYCPGHTDGIFSVIVSQGPSNRFRGTGDGLYGGDFAVFASDVALGQGNLTGDSIPGYGFDRKQQKKSIQFLKGLQADPRCAAVYFSHERPQISELKF